MVMSDEVRRRDRAHQILGLLDLTDLRPGVEADAIERLCARAVCVPGGVAAVCIAPAFVAQCARDLAGTGVKVATVVNFPAGSTDADAVAREVHGVIEHGADELDVVMPYGALLAGDIDGAARVLDTVAEIVQGRRIVKVILETGAFNERSAIVDAARFAVEHGADFLKTSTGTTPVSATPLAVGALLDVVRESPRAVGKSSRQEGSAPSRRPMVISNRPRPSWGEHGSTRGRSASGPRDSSTPCAPSSRVTPVLAPAPVEPDGSPDLVGAPWSDLVLTRRRVPRVVPSQVVTGALLSPHVGDGSVLEVPWR